MGVHVHPVGAGHDPVLALRPGLQAGLEEEAHRPLGVDERAGVLERQGGLPVHQPAHDAVRVVGAGEERELAQGVEPALGEPATAHSPGLGELCGEILHPPP